MAWLILGAPRCCAPGIVSATVCTARLSVGVGTVFGVTNHVRRLVGDQRLHGYAGGRGPERQRRAARLGEDVRRLAGGLANQSFEVLDLTLDAVRPLVAGLPATAPIVIDHREVSGELGRELPREGCR